MEKEIWKDIRGYEGLYQINSIGNVRSLDRFVKSSRGGFRKQNSRILTNSIHKHGHHIVNLWKENKSVQYKVYRLLAIAFISNPDNKPCVNHIDGNRMNLSLENLEWVTYSENMRHAYDNGLTNGTFKAGFESRFCKLSKEDILFIKSKRKNREMKLKDLAALFNIGIGHVSQIGTGKQWREVV